MYAFTSTPEMPISISFEAYSGTTKVCEMLIPGLCLLATLRLYKGFFSCYEQIYAKVNLSSTELTG